MDNDEAIRDYLHKLLSWRDAHVNFETVTGEFPLSSVNASVPGVPYTPWQLLEHLRLAQWDILEFCINPNYIERRFPDDYWPSTDVSGHEQSWNASIANFRKDLRSMIDVITDPDTNLFEPIPHGNGQTIFREALLLADHNAYHLGQLVMMRRFFGVWDPAK